jgi:hypothetical protein
MDLSITAHERGKLMTVWIPILLVLILAEVWWFGAHCTAYLSDIRDSLAKMTDGFESSQGIGKSSNNGVDS